MDVHVLIEKREVIKPLPRSEVLRFSLHQKCVYAFVSGRKAHAHGLQSVSPEHCIANRRRLLTAL